MGELHLDDLRIDSLVDLLKAAYSLEDWDRMIEIADKLLISAERVYSSQKQLIDSGKRYIKMEGKRHPVYYFGFGQMAKGIALQKKELYEESLSCIKAYADLSWLDDGSKEAAEEIAAFKEYAEGNTYSVSLLAGKHEHLDDFVKFIQSSDKGELIAELVVILDSALKYNLNVDSILLQFVEEAEAQIADQDKHLNEKRMYLAKYFHRMALYLFKEGKYSSALNYTLKTLEVSDKFNDLIFYKRSIALFDEYKRYADKEQQSMYSKIVRGGKEDKKGNPFNVFNIGSFKLYRNS